MARFKEELRAETLAHSPGEELRPKKGLRQRVWSYALGIIIESLAVVGISLLAWGLLALVKAITP